MKFRYSVVVTVPDQWVESITGLERSQAVIWCAQQLGILIEALAEKLPVHMQSPPPHVAASWAPERSEAAERLAPSLSTDIYGDLWLDLDQKAVAYLCRTQSATIKIPNAEHRPRPTFLTVNFDASESARQGFLARWFGWLS